MHLHCKPSSENQKKIGGIAQLARAPALQAGGHRFDSVYLHEGYYVVVFKLFDILEWRIN